jgi:hypothetical protein
MKNDKGTNNDLENIHIIAKDQVTRNTPKPGVDSSVPAG